VSLQHDAKSQKQGEGREAGKMKISEHVRTTITQDGAVLMNIKGGSMLTLNATGSIIWRQLSDGRTPAQIAAQLSSEFGIPLADASADVKAFLEQLEAQHLIESVEFPDSRKSLGPKPAGLFCNLFGRRNSESGQERGSR
jgi:hypothetical protein